MTTVDGFRLDGFTIAPVLATDLYTTRTPPNVLSSGLLTRATTCGLFAGARLRTDYPGSPINRFTVFGGDFIVLVGSPGASVPQRGTVLFSGTKDRTGQIVRQEVIYEPPERSATEKAPLQRFTLSNFNDITILEVRLSDTSIPGSVLTAATALDNLDIAAN